MVSAPWYRTPSVVVVDDASVAKMSGGDVDVEQYLDSRTPKYMELQLRFSKLEVETRV